MPDFRKSQKFDDNHIVEHDGNIAHFNDNETGKLYRSLEAACRGDTGYKTWEWQNEKSRVIAEKDGIIIESVVGNGNTEKINMSYGDAKNLLRAMEKQVGIEKDLETMS